MLRYIHQYQSAASSNKHPTVLDGPTNTLRDTAPSNISPNINSLSSDNRNHNTDTNSFVPHQRMYNVSMFIVSIWAIVSIVYLIPFLFCRSNHNSFISISYI